MNDRKSLSQRFKDSLGIVSRWLVPGLGVKRWILVILLGTTLIGVGLGVVILDIYRTSPDTWWLPALSYASLRFLARPLRALVFGGVGLSLIVIGILQLNRALLSPFRRPGKRMVDTLWVHRQRGRGPRIVAIGGGHGLSTVLQGLKSISHNLTAVVSVADDGGSSGRLRREQGILPPGDLRNCLVALSDDEALMGQLFQYRFSSESDGMNGHSFGNLFISALAEITGSFEEAVAESGRVLAVQGRVLPSTLHDVKLSADVRLPHLASEVRVQGESQIPQLSGVIRRVWLEPGNASAFPLSIQAILSADIIVVGPGSLYTSILPNLLVNDLAQAIRASRAFKLYLCNLATQRGETDAFSAEDHLRVLEDHVGGGLFDVVVCNHDYHRKLPEGIDWVRIDPGMEQDYPLYRADLVDDLHPWRHDPAKLAQVIKDLYEERTGPLVE